MNNLPPLSVASHSIIQSVVSTAGQIQYNLMTGASTDLEGGYRECCATMLRLALKVSGHGDPVRAEDVLENLTKIADNLYPELTERDKLRLQAEEAIRTIELESTDTDASICAIETLKDVIYDLLHKA